MQPDPHNRISAKLVCFAAKLGQGDDTRLAEPFLHRIAPPAEGVAKSHRNVLEQMHADDAFGGNNLKALVNG